MLLSADRCARETLEETDSRLERNRIRIANLSYGVTCQDQNTANRSATDVPWAIHEKQPHRDGPLPADDQYLVEYNNGFFTDQWGGKVDSMRSIGKGSALHQINGEGKWTPWGQCGDYIRCSSVHTDATRWTKVELSSMECLARGMISSMRSARSCKNGLYEINGECALNELFAFKTEWSLHCW